MPEGSMMVTHHRSRQCLATASTCHPAKHRQRHLRSRQLLRLSPGGDRRQVGKTVIGEHVHAIRDPEDWVRHVSAPLPGLPIGHGLDPTDPLFGAHIFTADNGSRDEHNGYFDAGTQAIGEIAKLIAPR